jgi:hypothetical protein
MKKISLNIEDDKIIMPFIDRFEKNPNLNRSMTVERDAFFLGYLYKEGISSVVKRFTYEELIILFSRFNSFQATNNMSPSVVKIIFSEIGGFTENSWGLGKSSEDKELARKIKGLSVLEMYSTLDFAIRFWSVSEINVDKRMETIGLGKEQCNQNFDMN